MFGKSTRALQPRWVKGLPHGYIAFGGIGPAGSLSTIAVDDLESDADMGRREETAKTIAVDDKVKAVDWLAKAAALPATIVEMDSIKE